MTNCDNEKRVRCIRLCSGPLPTKVLLSYCARSKIPRDEEFREFLSSYGTSWAGYVLSEVKTKWKRVAAELPDREIFAECMKEFLRAVKEHRVPERIRRDPVAFLTFRVWERYIAEAEQTLRMSVNSSL